MRLLSLAGLSVSRFHSRSLLVLLLAGSMLGCDKVPLTSPTGSTVTLTISSTSIPINGTARVTAAVIESSGTAVHDGTMVTFVGALGNFAPPEAPTVGGVARTTFTGTGSGTAKIGAFSGAAKATEIEVKVGGAAAEKVTVRTEPSAIPQTGGTVTVIASVTDASGNALPNTPISFTVDQGSLSSSSSTTDANGDARVTLTTNRTTKITANVAGKTAEFTVTALAAPAVAISACTAAQSIGVAINCTITPTVATGGSPIQNVTVNWGDNTGEQPVGSVTGATSVSHTYRTAGTFTLVASATDLNSQRGTASMSFVVTRVNPTISITASASTGSVGVPISFTVTPASAPPQPITDVTVDFGDGTTRSLGVISSAATLVRSFATEGTYTVTATVTDQSGGRGNATTQVVIGRASAPSVTAFSQTTGTGNGAGTKTFTMTVAAATGLSIRSVVVTSTTGTPSTVYSGTSGGTFTFTTSGVSQGSILTATVTDSAGSVATSQLVVQ